MAVGVPSLENALYLKDPLSIIVYTLRKYERTPKEAVPILSDLIISLPWQVSRFSSEPENLVTNMQADLQGVFSRIFAGTRTVTVNVTYQMIDTIRYDVTISVLYSLDNGELAQTGVTLPIVNGRVRIPEDSVQNLLGSI